MIYEEILLYHYPDFAQEYADKVAAGISPYEYVLNNENSLKVSLQLSDYNQS